MQDVKQSVGERVQVLRKRKDLSQEALASQIGIDAKSLSRLERGVHFPSLETLVKIRVVLGVELRDFFVFDPQPSAEELRDFLLRAASDADYETLQKMVTAVREALNHKA